jgi:predicted NAD/FAD-dependent oxidoreductase
VNRRQWLGMALGGGAALSACNAEPPPYDGGWVGADAERGHRLRDGPAALKSGSLPAPAETRRASVLIVGAGIAGLACARALMRSGVDDVHVLDLEDTPGGNSRGHRMGGMACPLGAHYLPVPDEHNPELTEWLAELGLCAHRHGRWVYDERHLCHSPQERVFMPLDAGPKGSGGQRRGQWFEGLLPPVEALPTSAQAATLAQYQRFADLVQALPRGGFTIPTDRSRFTAELQALDAVTFAAWLDGHALTAPALRWYLDYCCRDDYGADSSHVSAWAGLHYFASRHGFRAPRAEGDAALSDDHAVLTWPQGNAWLSERLAAPLLGASQRLHTARVALQVEEGRHEVAVTAWDDRAQQLEQWIAPKVVLAVPLFVAARLLRSPPAALQAAAAAMRHAPWLVANLQLGQALQDHPGAPPSWDSVVYGSPNLGYVDAMHQSTRPHAGPTVLTAYWPLGGGDTRALAAQRPQQLARTCRARRHAWT